MIYDAIKLFSFSFIQSVVLVLLCLLLPLSAGAGEKSPVLTIQDQGSTQDGKDAAERLRLNLTETSEGLKVDLHYLNKPTASAESKEKLPPGQEIPVGGDMMLFLDGQVVANQSFAGEELKASKILDPFMIMNGEHTLKAEIHSYPGGDRKKEIRFQIDATPVIDIQSPENGEGFDPLVTFDLFGQVEGNAGYIEMYVDEQLVTSFPLKSDEVRQARRVSELLGKKVEELGLLQGTHLLHITALAANGGKADRYLSFEIDAKPEIAVSQDQEGKFNSFTAIFPEASAGFLGNVDVFYKQGVIFSEQVKDPQFTLSRSAIEEAFKRHNHTVTEYPVDLVIAVRAGNGTEKWTRIEYL